MAAFIDLGTVSAEYSVAAERIIFETCTEDTLIVYSRDSDTISAGRFQNIESCVTEQAFKDNVKIVRRMSGGSCIFSSNRQITYSVILLREIDRGSSFKTICNGLVSALRELGIEGRYKEPNDVLVNGMKISGSAQYRKAGRMIQHGTVILENDQNSIDRYLVKKDISVRTTSVKDVIGRVPERNELVNALIKGFSGILGNIEKRAVNEETERKITSSLSGP